MKELLQNKEYGAYTCTHLLGIPSTGAVYKAYHRDRPDVAVALRTLQIHSDNIDKVVQESHDYMLSLKSINGPNIVPILDYGSDDYEYFVVMPYMGGSTLRSLLKQSEETPDIYPSLGEVYDFTESLGHAIEYLHNLGIAHGAIQPRNIVIDTNHQVYLADMGLTRLLKILFSLENTGSFWTGKYTAPEVWDGERITPSSDLYSLGCVLYHLVTGRPPYDGKTIYVQMEKHKNGVITPPHYIREGLPLSLTMFFLTAMAKTPPERFRSMQEFLYELKISIDGSEGESTNFFSPDIKMNNSGS